MSNNLPSVRYYSDSESFYLPSGQNSDDFINQYFYDFGEVQIELWHKDQNQQMAIPHHSQNSLKTPQNTAGPSCDPLDQVHSLLSLERRSSDFPPTIVNSEQSGTQIFEQSNSKISTELGKSSEMLPPPAISKTKPIKKLSKKPQQPNSRERKSSRIDNPSYKPRVSFSSSTRKGKHSQSKTQKFIKFMTRFYFNKNFNQYFNKKLRDRKTPSDTYEAFSVEEKIKVINEVIQSLQSYEMRMHYSVRDGNFLMGFSDEDKSSIQDFFWKVVRRAYQIKLETNIRRVLAEGENSKNNDIGFLDKKGQEQFEKAFEQIFQAQPYYERLVKCGFEQKMWEEFNFSKSDDC